MNKKSSLSKWGREKEKQKLLKNAKTFPHNKKQDLILWHVPIFCCVIYKAHSIVYHMLLF